MSIYADHVLPHVIDLAMRNRNLLPYRRRLLAAARGRVLEIGVGSGLNLPLYPSSVHEIVGLEPSSRLASMARRAGVRTHATIVLTEGSAEAMPLDEHSFDTVVTTWTLCSIPEVGAALAEVRRVLRPSGRLLFVEHGAAPDERVRKWQDRLTPVWKRIGGGCHLNRPMGVLIENAGFAITQLQTGYMKGPKPMTFMYEGCALPG